MSGVSPSGEEYVITEKKICISSTLLVLVVNHMAAQTLKEKKTSFFPLNFNAYMNLGNRERARMRNK